MNNATARKRTQLTIGLDLGDRRHTYYALDGAGKMAREGSLGNTRQQLATMARSYPGATVVMEAGTHSPWVSRFLQELGLRVIVANPRKTRAIYQNERKSDRRDAMMCWPASPGSIPHCFIPLSMAARRPSRICSSSNCAIVWCVPDWLYDQCGTLSP